MDPGVTTLLPLELQALGKNSESTGWLLEELPWLLGAREVLEFKTGDGKGV